MGAFLKRKSTFQIARVYPGEKKNFTGQHFRARGHFVSTAGVDEQMIGAYGKFREKEDRRPAQLILVLERSVKIPFSLLKIEKHRHDDPVRSQKTTLLTFHT